MLVRLIDNDIDISQFKNGKEIEITGSVELYRNELEIIPLRSLVKFV